MKNNILFIAEVSSNHSQDLKRCLQFIETAAQIGATSAKFQLFKIDELFAPNTISSEIRERRRKWELPISFLPDLAKRCQEVGIEFSCTPFYLKAVDELEPFVDFYKIASYELLWDQLLASCAKTGKPVVLSTGMATMSEIQHAVTVLKDNLCKAITLLHCTSAYPTPYNEANLSAIQTIREATGCEVGWSDHTVETSVIHRAIHRWSATTIEFHLDLDGKGEEYETGHCWLPEQIASVIRDINHGFCADGNGKKEPTPSELPDRQWRADPEDGLRPLKVIRDSCQP